MTARNCFLGILPAILFIVAVSSSNFQYQMDLVGPIQAKSLYQLPLASELLSKCTSDCADLRLFDQEENEIPYVILENIAPSESEKFTNMEISAYQETVDAGGESVLITLRAIASTGSINRLILDTNDRDFKKYVTVEGSYDQQSWQRLSATTIYDFSSQVDLRQTAITLGDANYPFYRLEIREASAPSNDGLAISLQYQDVRFNIQQLDRKKLRINAVRGVTAASQSHYLAYERRDFQPIDSQLDPQRNSIITLPANLPFDRIYFQITTPYYYRNITIYTSDSGKPDSYQYLAQGALYSFTLAGVTEQKNFLAIKSRAHPFYRLVIENKNSPPLKIEQIGLEWFQRNLFFMALQDSPKYLLRVGNPLLGRPEYDLVNFIRQDNWYHQPSQKLTGALIIKNPTYEAPESGEMKARIERVLLSVIVIFLVVGMGYWLYSLVMHTPNSGSKSDDDSHDSNERKIS